MKATQKHKHVRPEDTRRRGSLTDNSSLGTSTSSIDEAPVVTKETMTDPKNQMEHLQQSTREALLTALKGIGVAGTGLPEAKKGIRPNRPQFDDEGKPVLLYYDVVGEDKVDYKEIYQKVSIHRYKGSFFNECINIGLRGKVFENIKKTGRKPTCEIFKLCQMTVNGEHNLLATYIPPCEPGDWAYSAFPRQRLVEEILSFLIFPPNNYTVIHYMCGEWRPRKNLRLMCNGSHHSNCKVLKLLFNSILPDLVKQWLLKAETSKGRTALHYVALFGSTCILDVFKPFLNYKILNCKDLSNNTAIYYAAVGNNFPVFRWLMLNGADMPSSSVARSLLDEKAKNREFEAWTFGTNRMKALDRCMKAWVGYTFEDQLKLMGAMSEISTIFLSEKKDKMDFNLQIREKNIQTAMGLGDVALIMFAVPVCYSELEEKMPDKYPHIMRNTIEEKSGKIVNIFNNVLLFGDSATSLKSSQDNYDCGIYLWSLDEDLLSRNTTVSLEVDLTKVHDFTTQMVFIQLFAVKLISDVVIPKPKKGKKQKID